MDTYALTRTGAIQDGVGGTLTAKGAVWVNLRIVIGPELGYCGEKAKLHGMINFEI